jgi:hypothetical protein
VKTYDAPTQGRRRTGGGRRVGQSDADGAIFGAICIIFSLWLCWARSTEEQDALAQGDGSTRRDGRRSQSLEMTYGCRGMARLNRQTGQSGMVSPAWCVQIVDRNERRPNAIRQQREVNTQPAISSANLVGPLSDFGCDCGKECSLTAGEGLDLDGAIVFQAQHMRTTLSCDGKKQQQQDKRDDVFDPVHEGLMIQAIGLWRSKVHDTASDFPIDPRIGIPGRRQFAKLGHDAVAERRLSRCRS